MELSPAPNVQREWTRKKWLLRVTIGLLMLYGIGLIAHEWAFGQPENFLETAFGASFVLCLIIGYICFGYVADKEHTRRVAVYKYKVSMRDWANGLI